MRERFKPDSEKRWGDLGKRNRTVGPHASEGRGLRLKGVLGGRPKQQEATNKGTGKVREKNLPPTFAQAILILGSTHYNEKAAAEVPTTVATGRT